MDDFLAYQEARARGGAAAIFIEATAVHETGLDLALDRRLRPGGGARIAGIGDALRSHGAGLFLKLFHGGRERTTAPPRPAAVAPSAVPSPRFHVEPRALTRRDIADLIERSPTAPRRPRGRRRRARGVDAPHGYLGAQFFSPIPATLRDDEYDLEHGLRFGRQVLEAVRQAAGDGVAVGVRLAADEGPTGALGPAACARIARGLCGDGLVDFVDLALRPPRHADGLRRHRPAAAGGAQRDRGTGWRCPRRPPRACR